MKLIALIAAASFLGAAVSTFAQSKVWRVVGGNPIEECTRESDKPIPRMTHRGMEYDVHPVICKTVPKVWAPSYHYLNGVMVPSQQKVKEFTPCEFENGKKVIDYFTYGNFGGQDELWVICGFFSK